jgi:beta-lactamase regulating signal transducer with metallopeptidase domain
MLWWFVETVAVTSLLAGVAAFFSLSKRIGPTARHLLWLLVLIKLIVPPVVRSPWSFARPESFLANDLNQRIAVVPGGEPKQPCADASVSEGLREEEDSEPTLAVTQVETFTAVPEQHDHSVSKVDVQDERQPERRWKGLDASALLSWGFTCWVGGSLVLCLIQALRIVRFHRRVRYAEPAPSWLVDETSKLAAQLRVQVPELLSLPNLGTPMLWCLGRPTLILPDHLIKTLEATQWRGILAHELAHLRRGDHWVSRLELIAGLIWWWNPVYWLTCRRINAEAELACDSWVVHALPDDRLTYAEVLLQICSDFSHRFSAAPALGVAGSGPFFERRLTMILRDRVSCQISPFFLIAVGLVALLVAPAWTHATPAAIIGPAQPSSSNVAASPDKPPGSEIDDEDDEDGDDEDAVDSDDDDDDKNDADESDSKKAKSKESKSKKGDIDLDVDLSGIEDKIKSALGPDFEKKIEDWAEKFAKEMESKFGENSEFVKKMENFGKEMEKKYGEDSEFAKKMESFGKKMEKKFGPGSDFEKNIQKQFGPGSDFERKMKSFGDELGKNFGPGSDFEKKLKEKVRSAGDKIQSARSKVEKKLESKKDEKTSSPGRRREERIKALEARIQALTKELKALEESEKDDDRN